MLRLRKIRNEHSIGAALPNPPPQLPESVEMVGKHAELDFLVKDGDRRVGPNALASKGPQACLAAIGHAKPAPNAPVVVEFGGGQHMVLVFFG